MPNIFTRFLRDVKGDKPQVQSNGNGRSSVSDNQRTRAIMNNHTASSGASELRALANLINSAVDKIEAAVASRSQTFPSLDEPFNPETEAVRMSPDVAQQTSIIVSAAAQLTSAVRVPALSMMYGTLAFYISACIQVAIRCHVPEILREGGVNGVHVKDLATSSGTDAHKLARCMRLLATNHIFKEVSPDVFAHNKVSSLLDTGKPLAVILKDVEAKHNGTPGLAALVEHATDEGLKSAGQLSETLRSPERGKSGSPAHSSFTTAYKTDLPIWAWFELPENAYALKRFTVAMQGMQNMGSPGAILEGFDWKSLPNGALVVDVGGGIGSQTLALARAFGHLNFIVQDREAVIKDAREYWNSQFPEAIQSSRVKLEAHDFFTAQPVKKPAVFLLRMILHDWSDEFSLKILKELRAAAAPDTQLLVVDNTVYYACVDTTVAHDIPGATLADPPFPLLANRGLANTQPYSADLHMMNMLNGMERTATEFHDLLKQSGWKLDRVFHSAGFEIENAKLIATPI